VIKFWVLTCLTEVTNAGSPVNFSGRIYNPVLWCKKETGLLNYDKIQEIATREQKNDYCRASAYSRDMDFRRFRLIADSVGALLLAEAALKNTKT
jgi:glycine hydroxymethyltransferase